MGRDRRIELLLIEEFKQLVLSAGKNKGVQAAYKKLDEWNREHPEYQFLKKDKLEELILEYFRECALNEWKKGGIPKIDEEVAEWKKKNPNIQLPEDYRKWVLEIEAERRVMKEESNGNSDWRFFGAMNEQLKKWNRAYPEFQFLQEDLARWSLRKSQEIRRAGKVADIYGKEKCFGEKKDEGYESTEGDNSGGIYDPECACYEAENER